ncbi:MAG TPA: glycoside hydrolase family 88 protein [Chitinophagaceae bacterium]|nr:glycoside hydrolase family 88 protein [Chitinophagaceae bacterium]
MNKPLLSLVLLTGVLTATAQKQNDVTTPLHAMQPDYPVPYVIPGKADVKKVLDRIYNYLDTVTPPVMINRKTGAVLNDPSQLDTNSAVKQGDFRLTSYEWGVTYAAMLRAAETTGDKRYATYVKDRFDFLTQWVPAVKAKFPVDYIRSQRFLHQPIDPHALDDAGAVCAAMIKAQRAGLNEGLRPQIDVFINYIVNKEYRLKDGTLARNRPLKNTIWLDDMFMGVPAMAQMGKLTGQKKYFDEVVKQIRQFSARMFNKELGIFMHGWVESMNPHPEFHWGRANGWALLTLTEVLDVLPENHPGFKMVLDQYRAHVKGLAKYQDGTGFWHQLLDKSDSYLETSATAIYTYCIAHGVNKGWLDVKAYAPMSLLGWSAVASKVNDKGQVEGTCVGTGMAFDPAFYYHRPVNVFAAHGYGPALFAGAEITALLDQFSFRMNDSAIMLDETKSGSNVPLRW